MANSVSSTTDQRLLLEHRLFKSEIISSSARGVEVQTPLPHMLSCNELGVEASAAVMVKCGRAKHEIREPCRRGV